MKEILEDLLYCYQEGVDMSDLRAIEDLLCGGPTVEYLREAYTPEKWREESSELVTLLKQMACASA